MWNSNCSKRRVLVAAVVVAVGVVLFLFSQTLQVGYAVITVDSQDPMPVATALFSSRNVSGVLVAEAGVAAVEPISAGRVFVDENGPKTGIALANPSNSTINFTLSIRDVSGTVLRESPQSLDPRQHLPRYVDELFTDLEGGFVGSMTFRTTQPSQKLGAVTLRQNLNAHGEALLATLPVADLDSLEQVDRIVFPHLGAGGILTTQIILINGSDQTISGSIRLFSSQGLPLELELDGAPGSEFPYELEPNGVFRGNLTLDSNTAVAGYAVVGVDEGPAPAGTAVFQFRDGLDLMSEAGVGAIPATTRARIFVDNAGTQTGVALASPDNAAATVSFDLLDNNGFVIEQSQRNLPANGHLAIFADELFEDLPAGFTGLMEITSPVPIVPITLKLTQNSRDDFILTTLPIADLTRPIEAETLVFPQIGVGDAGKFGSFATRLISIQTETSEDASGTLSFFQSSGAVMQVPMSGEEGSVFDFTVPEGGVRQFYPGVTAELATMMLHTDEVVVNEGNNFPVRLVTLDEDGRSRDDFLIQYLSLSPDKVTVDDLGVLSGVSRGFATVVVSSSGIVNNVGVTIATLTGGTDAFEVTGIAQDSESRVYLSSARDHTILEAEDVTESPQVWAGKEKKAGFVNGLRLQSEFNEPSFLTLDQAQGKLYVSDSANHVIRLLQQEDDQAVQTLAGTGQPGSVDGGLNQARFREPQGVALDRGGNLWVVDSGNHTIRRLDLTAGTVATVAGLAGSAGNSDGIGSQARFQDPIGIAFETEPLAQQLERELAGDPAPPISMIVADTGNNALRRVWEDGTVETLSADNLSAASRDKDQQDWLALATIPFRFSGPGGVVVDSLGNIFVSEPVKGRVKILLTTGQVVEAAQPGSFQEPKGLFVTTRGRVVVAESSRTAQEIRYAGPSISLVEPGLVETGGGEQITILGSNLAPDSLVIVGGIPISNAQITENTSIRFTAPPLPSGKLTVTVRHRGGLDQSELLVTPSPLEKIGPGDITTVVGGLPYAGDGRQAQNANLNQVTAIAFDPAGNFYIADRGANRVRKVDAVTRLITTVAGTGDADYSGDGGPAVSATLDGPEDIAFDAAGHLYIADTGNHVVRRVSAEDGTITTFAGGGSQGWWIDGEPATDASLAFPFGVTVSADGEVFVTDTGHHLIRLIDPADGTIWTVAGNGEPGSSGDGSNAKFASLFFPTDLVLDSSGELFFTDSANNVVRKIDSEGIMRRVAGNREPGFSGDGGSALSASLFFPVGLARDSAGNLLIADFGNSRIRKVDLASQIISTLAGNGLAGFSGDGAAAVAASLNFPNAVEVNASGGAFIGDTGNSRVRRVFRKTGVIETVAGNGQVPEVGDLGPAYAASLAAPHGIDVSEIGEIFIADTGHQRIRRVLGKTLQSEIRTIAGTGERGQSEDGTMAVEAALDTPVDVVIESSESLLLVEAGNHRIRRLQGEQQGPFSSFFFLNATTVAGALVTIAGTGVPGYEGDGGPAVDTTLAFPHSVAVDSVGNIFIADRANHRIRRVDPKGIITTVAGIGEPGFSGDGEPAVQAALKRPGGVAVDAFDNLYIADSGNHRIRRVSDGLIETIVGSGKGGYSGDGGLADQAQLNLPHQVAIDFNGDLYIADWANHAVRRVDAETWVITTVAGTGVPGFFGDGGSAREARLHGVEDIAFDRDGNLFISDSLNRRIRVVRGPLN